MKIKGNHSNQGPAERLLQAADRLFYTRGYAATGVNELMAEAGVAKASFYRHFPSKSDLVVAYLQHRRDAWFSQLTEKVEQHSDPTERVLAVFDFLHQWMVESAFRGCAFLNTIPEFPEASTAPRQVVREAKQGLRDYIHTLCQNAGHSDAGDEVFLLMEGAISQAAVVTDVWPIEVAQQAVRRRLKKPNV